MFTHSYGENRTDLLHEPRPASFSHSPRDRILSSGLRETRAVPTPGLIKHTRAAHPRKIPFDLFYNVEGCRTAAIVLEVLIFSHFLEISRGAQLFAARFFLFDRIFHRARIEWGGETCYCCLKATVVQLTKNRILIRARRIIRARGRRGDRGSLRIMSIFFSRQLS